MYRLNPLGKNVLITPDEVINQASTKHSIDHKMIQNNIIIAEERFIRPALGYKFYQALIAEKNKVITDSNKATEQTNIDEAYTNGPKQGELKEGIVLNASEYLSADNKSLWTDGLLWKLCAEAVMLISMPEGFVQFGSAGVIHNSPPAGPMTTQAENTPELRSVKWMMDKKLMDRIDPLTESLHQWICKQKDADSTKFSLYCKECDCDSNGIAYKRKSNILLNIYEDDDD